MKQVINSDGDLTVGSISHLKLCLKSATLHVKINQISVPGGSLVKGFEIPSFGTLYETGPSHYTVVARLEKRPLDLEADNAAQNRGIYTAYSYAIAAQEYAPTVVSLLDGWQPDTEHMFSMLTVDGAQWLLGEVQIDPYVKQPYLTNNFNDFEKHRPQVEEFAIQSAMVSARKNPTEVASLLQKIREAALTAETEPVRSAFMAIAEELSATVPEK